SDSRPLWTSFQSCNVSVQSQNEKECKMQKPQQISLMRIYTDEAAMHGDETVVTTIIARARSYGLRGGTVLKGILGFSSSSIVHEHHAFGIGDNPPVVIEIIDARARLEDFYT